MVVAIRQYSNSCLIFECYLPIKDGAYSSTVGAASVDVEARRQQDAIFYRDWAMREWGDKELIPAWMHRTNDCDLSILKALLEFVQMIYDTTAWICQSSPDLHKARNILIRLLPHPGLCVISLTTRSQRWCSCKPHCWDLANSPVIFGFTAPLN